MRVAICDDEAIYREETKKAILAYNKEIDIAEYTDGSELVQSGERFDLIFLDIEMPKMDGMEAAKKLRENKDDAEIVFLTSHDEFVYDAFDVRAMQFLKKPPEKEKIERVLHRVEQILAKEERVEFILNGQTCFVKQRDIVYIEAYGDGVYIYDCAGNVYEERRGTIKKWNEKLSGKGFAQIQRGYLISMWYVERFGTEKVKLKGVPRELEVSRRCAADFKKAFFEFVNRNGRIL